MLSCFPFPLHCMCKGMKVDGMNMITMNQVTHLRRWYRINWNVLNDYTLLKFPLRRDDEICFKSNIWYILNVLHTLYTYTHKHEHTFTPINVWLSFYDYAIRCHCQFVSCHLHKAVKRISFYTSSQNCKYNKKSFKLNREQWQYVTAQNLI